MSEVPSFRYWRRLASMLALSLLACSSAPPPAGSAAPMPVAASPQRPTLQERLRDRLAQTVPLTAPPELDAELRDFYRLREARPAWDQARSARDLMAALAQLEAHGLTPQDYDRDTLIRQLPVRPELDPDSQLALELRASRAALLALIHLHRGKLRMQDLQTQWQAGETPAEREVLWRQLSQAIDDGGLPAVFAAAAPAHPVYARLRAALARYRQLQGEGEWPTLPDGSSLKPGMRDARVVLLRERLRRGGVDLPAAAEPEFFDAELEQALRAYQQAQYLEDDGALGVRTRAALNVGLAQRIDQIRVNLERGRWLLQGLPERFVLVDIAGYRIAYFHGGQAVWRARVQVGRTYRSTPSFRSQIEEVEFNPTWTVPPTILREDILPRLPHEADYLRKNHLHVLSPDGRELDPSGIDWHHPPPLVLRQEAGPDGALGRVALRFANPYSVFLHDTPHQELFAQARRNFSSGCIRVERAMELARLLLDEPQRWTDASIDAILATRKTRSVRLRQAVPLIVQYWTVDVPEDGSIAFKTDAYERDAPLLEALNRSLSSGY